MSEFPNQPETDAVQEEPQPVTGSAPQQAEGEETSLLPDEGRAEGEPAPLDPDDTEH